MPAVGLRFANLDFGRLAGGLYAGHGLAAFGLEPRRLAERAFVLVSHRAFGVLEPARVFVVAGFLIAPTLSTLNMPPISTEPNGPSPVIMGTVLSGMGISISVMSAMPRSPMTM